jgi:two-component system phosphate regulon sensor histidine kinase PhoR
MRRRIFIPYFLLIVLILLGWGFLSILVISQFQGILPPEQAQATLARWQRIIIYSVLFYLLMTVPVAFWVAGRVAKPLMQMVQQAALTLPDIAAETSLPEKPKDEVHLLGRLLSAISLQFHSHQASLEAEKERFSTLLEATNDGIVIVDAQGWVRTINTSAERLFGLHRQNILDRSLAESLRHYQIVELWRNCQQTGRPQSTLLEISTLRLYLQVSAFPLTAQSPPETLLLFQNLTRQRYLETVRRDFISNLSHELRTPLASLKALTETLQEGALEDPVAARRFLQRIESEVDALTQMVNELLDLSRIESGKVSLQKRNALPQEILLPAVNRLRLQAERAGLKVEVDCPEGLPAIQVDVSRLEQVVLNLLHNAIKFTPGGGTIHISARASTEGENYHPALIFAIRDSGVGIPAEDLPRIFERFYKADRARTSNGSGLGLAIARHIVEAHGGKIWAESVEGQGSTFYFSLPLNDLDALP